MPSGTKPANAPIGFCSILILCIFAQAGYATFYTPKEYGGITANDVKEFLNLTTGREISFDESLSKEYHVLKGKACLEIKSELPFFH